jgi:hypothetical protein
MPLQLRLSSKYETDEYYGQYLLPLKFANEELTSGCPFEAARLSSHTWYHIDAVSSTRLQADAVLDQRAEILSV